MLLNELLEKEYHDAELPSPVGIVFISKEKNVYNALRKKYQSLAKEAEQIFSEIYTSYSGCNDILIKSSSDFQQSISAVIDELKKDLISIGRYDLDYDTIFQYAADHGLLDGFYKPSDIICEKIIAVNENLEEQMQYRQARKDNRSRWEGASFGGTIVDNYAHQANMGMRNVAEGVGYSLFNMAGNSVSKMQANSALKKIFNDRETRKTIQAGVFDAAFDLHYAVVKLSEGYADHISWDYPSESDRITSQRLLNNVTSKAVPADKVNELYLSILKINPYMLALFENMLAVFGDVSGELGALADYYGINLNQSKDSQALKYVQEIQGETEEESWAAKDKLLLYCETISLPVSDDLECMKYIIKRQQDFDLQYRTIDGVECTTRDAADESRGELEAIQTFMEQIQAPTSESLLDYEEDLLIKRAAFDEQFNSELKAKYMQQLDGYLTDFEKKFCSTGLFKRVDRKQAGKDRLLKLLKKTDTSTLEKIDDAFRLMEELMPKLGLEHDETQEAAQYLEKRRENILNPKSTAGILKGFGKLFKK